MTFTVPATTTPIPTVLPDTLITATFNKVMAPASISSGTFTVTGPGATIVTGKVSYDATDQIATFTPTSDLAASTTFTATITGAQDLSGNVLAPVSWQFTTGSAATGQTPPDPGAG